jgi:Phage tail sheath C-terminal domain
MALNSPGVQVSIIDQSQYLPAASNSIPLLILATATDKENPTSLGTIAAGTLPGNANKLYQLTSQRDLITLFGNPFFYKTTDGTPIHGYELNEYGLLAAYSLLGVTNSCYILRADIDLAEMIGTLTRPAGPPPDGTYWLDTTNSMYGIYEFNAETSKFDPIDPIVITSPNSITSNTIDRYPLPTIGNPGDYAVIPTQVSSGLLSAHTFFYKTAKGPTNNVWVPVGSRDWKLSYPLVTGTETPITLTAGHHLTFTTNSITRTVTVPASPNNSLSGSNGQGGGLVDAINALQIADLYAKAENGSLVLYYGTYGRDKSIAIGGTDGESLLADLGITAKAYFNVEVKYGTSAQMPLWTKTQDSPRPSGSVWIKTSMTGAGMDLSLNQYNQAKGQFIAQTVNIYQTELYATYDLDTTGGQAIPAGTIMASLNPQYISDAAMQFYYRNMSGPTVITGTVSNPDLTSHIGETLKLAVSVPGSSLPSNTYYVPVTDGTLETFVINWAYQQIPNTTATITTDGLLQITHTAGGDIFIGTVNPTGTPSTLGVALGFSINTPGVRRGFLDTYRVAALPQNSTTRNGTPGSGTGATFDISNERGQYVVNGITVGGASYQVGDHIIITGDHLAGATPTNDLTLVVQSVSAGVITSVSIGAGTQSSSIARPVYFVTLSNWYPLDYIANEGAPAALPLPQKHWYYSTATEVDIMVKKGTQWVGYKNTNYDAMGHPTGALLTGTGNTNAGGIIISATIPTTQDNGSALQYGDLWLNSTDLENYPNISRWEEINTVKQWVAIDNTDQVSSSGILFADARWGVSGKVDPVNDPLSTISGLTKSNYLDLDAPNARLYPQGMLMFNTRRSGFNVKRFEPNWFTNANYPNAYPANDTNPAHTPKLPDVPYAWVSSSGHKADGSAYMGRKAQRNMIVQALKAAINTNMQIREEDTFINLIASPNYPELQPDMITLNNDRNQTAFIIGDTPLRLNDQATNLTNWANNRMMSSASGEDGWVTRDSYMGVFYPSGITSDLSGTPAVVPASHMVLRTFLTNDTIAYPWLAAAGVRRGNITNATNIGYLDGATGEFKSIKNRNSIRDVLYTNQINPLAYFTGVGLLNYGNKTSYGSNSALDRINVARLVCYIRYQLQIAARPFVFEPNDALTRSQVTSVVQSLFIDLVAKRGLYDYLVVCDTNNNTPSRIDRNELWIDVAISPVKAAEFIYIPVRIANTGTNLAKLINGQ